MFYLGIDQHAKQLTVSLRDSTGDVVLRRQVSTQPDKVLEFFEQLTRRCAEHGCGFWAVVEVCGFNGWLLEMLKNFRCERIVLVQPEDTDRRKTDRRDAAKLSELKQHREDLLRYTLRVTELDAVIAELSKDDEDVKLLMQTPGGPSSRQ